MIINSVAVNGVKCHEKYISLQWNLLHANLYQMTYLLSVDDDQQNLSAYIQCNRFLAELHMHGNAC